MGKQEEKWRRQVAAERKLLFGDGREESFSRYISAKERNRLMAVYHESREFLNRDTRRDSGSSD